jgi:hypothetical protein
MDVTEFATALISMFMVAHRVGHILGFAFGFFIHRQLPPANK